MRVLVDTSVWIDFLRDGNLEMSDLLDREAVEVHPFVVGELACGNLTNRRRFLEEMTTMPTAAPAGDEEVLAFVEANRLYGSGLNWVDAHLLASALISGSKLWSKDKPLQKAAETLKVAF